VTDTVLVTGSSRGIGRAIALRLARAGFAVVAHGRAESAALDETLAGISRAGVPGRGVSFDVSDREGAAAALTADIEAHGAYYGVVCNAGIARDGAFPALTGEDWDRVLDTNLNGFYNVMHPVIMPMIRRRKPGRIVTLSSVSGVAGNRGQVNYSAAKAGIIGATKALAIELASRQITVNCVAPGLIRTDMTVDAPIEEALKLIPAGRIGEPEEVAGVVSFLMTAEAAYITRQVIGVNGGLV
jgi:3-oxoacyl-[acyl-carrier protein] reductase